MVPTRAAAAAIVPTPATAWATGEFIGTASAPPDDEIYWDGTGWQTGIAP